MVGAPSDGSGNEGTNNPFIPQQQPPDIHPQANGQVGRQQSQHDTLVREWLANRVHREIQARVAAGGNAFIPSVQHPPSHNMQLQHDYRLAQHQAVMAHARETSQSPSRMNMQQFGPPRPLLVQNNWATPAVNRATHVQQMVAQHDAQVARAKNNDGMLSPAPTHSNTGSPESSAIASFLSSHHDDPQLQNALRQKLKEKIAEKIKKFRPDISESEQADAMVNLFKEHEQRLPQLAAATNSNPSSPSTNAKHGAVHKNTPTMYDEAITTLAQTKKEGETVPPSSKALSVPNPLMTDITSVEGNITCNSAGDDNSPVKAQDVAVSMTSVGDDNSPVKAPDAAVAKINSQEQEIVEIVDLCDDDNVDVQQQPPQKKRKTQVIPAEISNELDTVLATLKDENVRSTIQEDRSNNERKQKDKQKLHEEHLKDMQSRLEMYEKLESLAEQIADITSTRKKKNAQHDGAIDMIHLSLRNYRMLEDSRDRSISEM